MFVSAAQTIKKVVIDNRTVTRFAREQFRKTLTPARRGDEEIGWLGVVSASIIERFSRAQR